MPMPTESVTLDPTARLTAARDEALRRYTQHLTAVHLRNSRWQAVRSRGRTALRSHLTAASVAAPQPATHAR